MRTPPNRLQSARSRRTIRRRRVTAVGLLLVVASAVATVALSAGSGTTQRPGQDRGRAAPSRTTSRSHRATARRRTLRITGLARVTLTLSEPAPASIATGRSATGQPVRVLPTVVRYPTLAAGSIRARFPLVVFSHGFDKPASVYSALLTAWARAGYVVAAPTYPLTDPTQPGGVNESDIVNHPRDLRFVIEALQTAARDPHSRLHRVLDPRNVAVAGHSDGGDVSLAVAANSCCRDTAVKAAMILSGAELAAFDGTYFSRQGSVPLLAVQGSEDTINVPGCSAQLYDQSPPPKYYLDVIGAGHLPPYISPGPIRTGIARTTIAFLDAFLKHRAAPLAQARSHLPHNETLTSASTAPGPTGETCPGAP